MRNSLKVKSGSESRESLSCVKKQLGVNLEIKRKLLIKQINKSFGKIETSLDFY